MEDLKPFWQASRTEYISAHHLLRKAEGIFEMTLLPLPQPQPVSKEEEEFRELLKDAKVDQDKLIAARRAAGCKVWEFLVMGGLNQMYNQDSPDQEGESKEKPMTQGNYQN